MLEEVRSAVQVVIASFVYDNAALTDLLVRRLADRSAFDLTVLVDKEKFEERECRGEHPSLQRLQRAGAEVFLCRGQPPLGAFHIKALVTNRRTAFVGNVALCVGLCWVCVGNTCAKLSRR